MEEYVGRAGIEREVSFRERSRNLALIAGLVPGWGPIYWGRERLGLILFTLFASCFFSFTYSYFFYVGPYRLAWVQLSTFCWLAVHVASWAELFLRTRPSRVRHEDKLRANCLKQGIVYYLEDNLAGAIDEFQRALVVDPFDIEAQFRLGVMYSRAGRPREARRWLRRARRYDIEQKWFWELERELKRLKPSRVGEDTTADSRAEEVSVHK